MYVSHLCVFLVRSCQVTKRGRLRWKSHLRGCSCCWGLLQNAVVYCIVTFGIHSNTAFHLVLKLWCINPLVFLIFKACPSFTCEGETSYRRKDYSCQLWPDTGVGCCCNSETRMRTSVLGVSLLVVSFHTNLR